LMKRKIQIDHLQWKPENLLTPEHIHTTQKMRSQEQTMTVMGLIETTVI
jgi:hypothetical protein